MKRDVLSRYEQAPEGTILIDVAATRVEDLYNNFDRNAPYIRRDLDQDLVDYLIDCARELGKAPFAIRFTLAHVLDDDRIARIQRSVQGFFLYLVELERQEVSEMIRRSLILFSIGVAIMFISVWVNHLVSEHSVVGNVFAEGLTVAAWVSLWEALATFLIEWFPKRKNILLYHRLADAQLVFRSQSATMRTMVGETTNGADYVQPTGPRPGRGRDTEIDSTGDFHRRQV